MSNVFEHSYIFNPTTEINYADEAVVSKTILKKPAGNITLFSFDTGEGLSEHSTPHDAMVQILDGEAEVRIGTEVHILRSGECIMLPANIPHALKANERFKMMLTMIKNLE